MIKEKGQIHHKGTNNRVGSLGWRKVNHPSEQRTKPAVEIAPSKRQFLVGLDLVVRYMSFPLDFQTALQ